MTEAERKQSRSTASVGLSWATPRISEDLTLRLVARSL